MCDLRYELGEKIRYLREVEGGLRGAGSSYDATGTITCAARGDSEVDQPILFIAIESGARRHMTQSTRTLLAKFFKVHPGFLVDDPEGYHTELVSDLRTTEGSSMCGCCRERSVSQAIRK